MVSLGDTGSSAPTVARRESKKLPEKTAPVEKEVLRCRLVPLTVPSSPPSCSIKWMLEGFSVRQDEKARPAHLGKWETAAYIPKLNPLWHNRALPERVPRGLCVTPCSSASKVLATHAGRAI